jgi:biotin carboxyl carrier protein
LTKRGRSPVLGYNHNLRYGGRTFHVQTEDSGQGYARLYTHLFYEGTILSSKKQEYDPEAPEDAVRALMQKLHKSMIKELTHREHDARIGAFFIARGEPAMLEDRAAPVLVEVAAPVPVAAPAVPVAPEAVAVVAPAAPPAEAAPARPKIAPKPVVVVQPAVLKRSPVQVSNPADGVVVRRNVVINVGAGQPPVQGTINPAPAPAPQSAGARMRAGAHYAVRDGGSFVAGNRARSSGTESQSQPLASSREIRMPWETPAPQRVSQPVTSAAPSHPAGSAPAGKIRMPWDPPAPAGSEPFSGELVSDKSLDEVILEYLADDGEGEER